MNDQIKSQLRNAKLRNQKKFAVLVDPDKTNRSGLIRLSDEAVRAGVDYLFIGGSLLVNDSMDECLEIFRDHTDIPLILFPGSPMQINVRADALLLLSLISGRNADLLIGQHVLAAPHLRSSGLELLSTGYMLVDGGAPTTVSYISSTHPIPANKPDIAQCTAIAGEMLGLQHIYLDAGSGAKNHVPPDMIRAVSHSIDCPLIVGGGIRTAHTASVVARAGAEIVVVGNAIEQNVQLIGELADAVHRSHSQLTKK